MTTPSPQPPPAEPTYADRVYRSPAGLVTGVLLLAFVFWVGGDAVVRGTGLVRWLGLAGLVLVVPLVFAFTLRPAVYANADRLRVRNPFRTITLPWASVALVRATYSSEVITEEGAKYQIWAVPVSLRQRKQAARKQAARGGRGPGPTDTGTGGTEPHRAPGDRTIAELQDLAERGTSRPDAQGEPRVRWAYEVIAPAVAGAVAFVVLLVVA
ncbi:PH domain-containing protein [Streptomyces sp. NPDC059176]|uniref:PH domain-containing protein n=1 Tax=unclassified Streptomyces TaxID=2593676 RepID=UPI0036C037CE